MAGVFIQRAGTLLNATRYAGAGTEQPIGSYKAGDIILLRPRGGIAFVNAVTTGNNPAAPVAWEGPYIRIYPNAAPNRDFHPRGQKSDRELAGILDAGRMAARHVWQKGETYSQYDGGTIALATEETDPFYEFDAMGCPPIVLPFNASLSLYTDCAGSWAFDLFASKALAQDVSTRREYRQSRSLAGGSALQSLKTPMGAIDWSLSGSGSALVSFENAGKVAASGTSTMLVYDGTTGNELPGLRRSLCGATAIEAQAGAGGNPDEGCIINFFCNLG